MASMDFIKSPIENHRSKHIDVKLFFVRDLYYKEVFILKYINSKNNLADPFTKPLTKSDLNKFKSCIFSTQSKFALRNLILKKFLLYFSIN